MMLLLEGAKVFLFEYYYIYIRISIIGEFDKSVINEFKIVINFNVWFLLSISLRIKLVMYSIIFREFRRKITVGARLHRLWLSECWYFWVYSMVRSIELLVSCETIEFAGRKLHKVMIVLSAICRRVGMH